MPPRDPRLCPALEVALPADDVPNGTWERAGIPADVLFGDGEWHPVMVIARWVNRRGKPVVQLEWTAGLTRWSGEYVGDGEKVREG